MPITVHHGEKSASLDWRKQASEELRAKLRAERDLVATLLEQERIARASREEAEKRAQDLLVAAAALGIKIEESRVDPIREARYEPSAAPTTARDVILQQLAENPGMKSAELRVAIEGALGRGVHYKTPGMTLYRLAEDGLVQREGHRWFLKEQKKEDDFDSLL